MSVSDDQRPYVEAALREAEDGLVVAYSSVLLAIVENLREVVRLYGEDGQIVAALTPHEKRLEKRPCKGGCGEPFQPGQAYVVDGPFHIGCMLLDDRRKGTGS